MSDLTRLLQTLQPTPDGESAVRHRTAVVDAVNADGTVDLDFNGTIVPDVSVLDGAPLAVGNVVQVVAWAGDLLVLGRTSTSSASLGWTTWAPSLVNLNIGSTGTQIARYTSEGNTVWWYWSVTLGGSGISVGDVGVTLPFAPAAHYAATVSQMGKGILLDAGSAVFDAMVRMNGGATGFNIRYLNTAGAAASGAALSSTAPFTWVAGDQMNAHGFYEVA